MYIKGLREYNGELLSVKTIAGMVQLSPSTLYKYLNQGLSIYDAIEEGKKQSTKVFKNRPKTNNRVATTYLWNGKMATIDEIASATNISKEPLYRRLKQGLSLEDAIRTIQSHIAHKYPFMGGFYSLWKISLITGVPMYYLEKNLENQDYTEEEMNQVIKKYQKPEILMYQGKTLLKYCIDNQFNYNVIYNLIKRHECTVEEAISFYVEKGQMSRFPYSFVVGDILLSHFCIMEQLDDRYLLDKLRSGKSVEDSIISCIFLSKESYKTRSKRIELYRLYNQHKEDVEKYLTSADDISFMHDKERRIEEVLTDYKILQAISVLPTATSSEERKYILSELGLSLEEVLERHDEFLKNFEDITGQKKNSDVRYMWRKQEEGKKR